MFARNLFTAVIAATAIAAAFATPAFASGEATYDYPQVITSSVSRADVQSAAIEARKLGLISEGERSLVAEITMGMSQLSRAQVRAELAEARRLGLVGGGDQYVIPTDAQLESIRLAGQRAAMPMVASR